jgi:hypothetical protein
MRMNFGQRMILAGACLGVALAVGAEHKALATLLKDLKGWQAEPATSMTMDAGGDTLTSATRSYAKGDANFSATVVISKGAYTQSKMMDMKFESDAVKVQVVTLDGFTVQTTYTSADKSGILIVVLDKNDKTSRGALATFAFNGISEADALALAKQFDWKKLQTTAQAMAK